MKTLSTTALTELVTKTKAWCRSSFLDKTEVEQASTIDIDSAPTASSANLVTSGGVKAALNAQAADLAKTDRSLDALWKLSEGQVYDFEEDTSTAYQKTIPTGAKYGRVKSIGGRTVVWNQLGYNLSSQTINGVNLTANANGSMTFNGTASANAPFYLKRNGTAVSGHKMLIGDLSKYTGGVAVARLQLNVAGAYTEIMKTAAGSEIITLAHSGMFDLYFVVLKNNTVTDLTITPMIVDLTKMFGSGNEPTSLTDERILAIRAYAALHPEYNAGQLVSAGVDKVIVTDTESQSTDYPISAATQAMPGYGWSAGSVCNEVDFERHKYIQRVGSRTYQSGDESDATLTTDGTTTHYPLATPVETDITDTVFDEPFTCEAGGTITMHQSGTELPVPNSEEYIIKLSEVSP